LLVLRGCCGVNHGNQKNLCLFILYKVEIVIIYLVVYLFMMILTLQKQYCIARVAHTFLLTTGGILRSKIPSRMRYLPAGFLFMIFSQEERQGTGYALCQPTCSALVCWQEGTRLLCFHYDFFNSTINKYLKEWCYLC
jgi:hypothetical protein